MKHLSARVRKIARYVSLCLMVAAAILAVTIVASVTVDLGPAARQEAESAASSYLDRPVRIGRLSIHLLTGKFVVDDLTIAGLHPGDRPFFTAKHLALAMDWATTVQRTPEFTITSVDMTDWQMLVEKWDGADNFPSVVHRSQEPEGPRRFTTTLKYFHASRGQFAYEDHESPWSIVCPNLDITIGNLPDYHGEAVFHAGTLRIQDFKPMWVNMRAQFTLDGPRVNLTRIDIASDGASIIAHGNVDVARWPNQGYAFQTDVSFPRMRDIFFGSEDWQMAGDGHFTGTFQLTKRADHTEHDLQGTFTSNRLTWNGWEFPSLHGSLRWTPTSFKIWDGAAKPFGGDVRFTYAIEPLGGPGRSTSRLDAQYAGLNMAALSDHEAWRGLRLDGVGSGHHLLTWPTGRFDDRQNEGVLDIAPPPGVVPMTASAQPDAGPAPIAWTSYAPIAAQLAYRFDREHIEFDPSQFATEGTFVAFQGSTAWGQRSRLAFHVTSRDWQESDRLMVGVMNDFGASASQVAFGGRGEFDGVMTGPFDRARVDGTFTGENLRAFDTLWGDGTGHVRYENSYITVANAVIRHGGSEIRADGAFSTDSPREDGGNEIDARFRFTHRDLDSLRHAFEADDYPISGFVSGDVHLAGARARPIGFGSLTVEHGVAWQEPIDTFSASLRLDGAGVWLDNVAIAKGSGRITGAAFVGWDSTYSFDMAGSVPVDRIALFQVPKAPLTGGATFTARGRGTFDNPRNDVNFSVTNLTIAHQTVGQVTGQLAMRGTELSGQIDAASPTLAVTGAGRILLTPERTADLNLRFHQSSLDPWLRVFLPGASPNTTAVASGTVHLAGPLRDANRVTADATVDTLDMRLFDYAVRNAAPIRLTLDRGDLAVRDLHLVGDDTRLAVSGVVGLQRDAVALKVNGAANLGILQGFFRDVRGAGRAELTASIDGSLRRPLFSGSATIADGRIRHFSLPNSLDAINGTVNFDERGIRLDGVTATMGGGRVQLGGRIGFDGYFPSDVDVTAHGENMQLRLLQGLRSTLDADLVVTGPFRSPTVGGTVTVKNAVWNRRLDDPANILDIVRRFTGNAGGGTPLAGEQAAPSVPLAFNVRIVVPATLSVDTNLLRMNASADVNLLGTYDRPVVTGHADIERGDVNFEGHRYRLTHGTVDFNNPGRIEPFFDVQAETNVRVPSVSGSVAQNYRIDVGFTGTTDKLVPTLSSDPPLPSTADVLALLFSDVRRSDVAELRQLQNPNQVQTDILTARATQALTAPISSEVGKVVEQTFGVDTFQLTPSFIDPFGQQTSRLSPTARLTIGKRVSDRVYLTFSRSLGTTINDQIILLEYEQNDRVSWVLSRNEDQQTYALDFRLRQSF